MGESEKIRVLEAAGGLVTDVSGDCLMIYRYGRWDLPKGHIEAGETIGECALREVSEETGLSGLSIVKPLCETFHTYELHGEPVIKHTNWFLMRCEGSRSTLPQVEEDITRAEWIPRCNLRPFVESSYENIKDVFRTAGIF